MYRLFFILFFLFSFTLKIEADFSLQSCDDQKIFFLVSLSWKQAELSNFYCDFWKTIPYDLSISSSNKIWTFVSYDRENKVISSVSKVDLLKYASDLKSDFREISNNQEVKNNIIDSYLSDFFVYENDFFKLVKGQIFTKNEQKVIEFKLEKTPLKVFQNTYWQRLLMDWKIISREEWWADESYSKKEVYMKWCENWSCYTWPVAKNQLKDNYIAYFNYLDSKHKLTKTFDDWRDALSYYPVDRIIIHHTAWGYKWIKSEWMDYMKAVQKYHAITLRRSDIWYHYLIDWEWNIYEWRAGWKYVLWAHVATHNYWSIWISLMSDWYYSPEMLSSLQDLIVYLWKEYNLDLTKETTVRNNDLTWWTQGWALVAHKELDSRKPTDPEIDMNQFREQIASKVWFQNYVLKYKNNWD